MVARGHDLSASPQTATRRRCMLPAAHVVPGKHRSRPLAPVTLAIVVIPLLCLRRFLPKYCAVAVVIPGDVICDCEDKEKKSTDEKQVELCECVLTIISSRRKRCGLSEDYFSPSDRLLVFDIFYSCLLRSSSLFCVFIAMHRLLFCDISIGLLAFPEPSVLFCDFFLVLLG